MNFLQGLKVRTRIALIACSGALVTLLVGLAGLTQMSSINTLLNDMYENNLVPVADIANANIQAIYHHGALLTYVAEPDRQKMKLIRVEMDKHQVQMNLLLDKYRKTELTPSELDLVRNSKRHGWPTWPPPTRRQKSPRAATTPQPWPTCWPR